MDEFALIRRYFSRTPRDSDVLLGVGDDGAVVRTAAGHELVIVIDTQVEGVHFLRNMDAADIAYRAVVVNLSDIAAMGARPRWMTLALTLAESEPNWLERFSKGLFEAADEYSLELIGGDTTRGSQTVITIQLTGEVKTGTALRRSGAKPGDGIFVTGTLGDAAAGLALWQGGSVQGDHANYLYQRFSRPEARVTFASTVAQHVTSAIDLSDGTYADIEKLLQASEVGGSVDITRLPLSDSLVAIRGTDCAIETALGGGDDYEIAFTASADWADEIARLATACSLRVTRVGTVTAERGLQCLKGNSVFDYQHPGYRHFGDDEND